MVRNTESLDKYHRRCDTIVQMIIARDRQKREKNRSFDSTWKMKIKYLTRTAFINWHTRNCDWLAAENETKNINKRKKSCFPLTTIDRSGGQPLSSPHLLRADVWNALNNLADKLGKPDVRVRWTHLQITTAQIIIIMTHRKKYIDVQATFVAYIFRGARSMLTRKIPNQTSYASDI